jgi:hypothetical protein
VASSGRFAREETFAAVERELARAATTSEHG